MQKVKLDSSQLWVVLPPKKTQKEIDLYSINISKLAKSKDEAWDKFTYPALKREAYKKDGFKAIRVDIFIREVE